MWSHIRFKFNQSIPANCKYYSDRQFACNVRSDSDLFISMHESGVIKEFLDDLKLSFDIIAISETWAESNTTEDFLLNGYEMFHVEGANRKGGGVALFVIRRFKT